MTIEVKAPRVPTDLMIRRVNDRQARLLAAVDGLLGEIARDHHRPMNSELRAAARELKGVRGEYHA